MARWRTCFFVGLLALALSASSASAATWNVGDVFASTGSGQVKVFTSAGVLKETLNTGEGGFTTGSTFDAAGNFYVTGFSGGTVSRFELTHPHAEVNYDTGLPTPESVVFNATGHLFVGNVGGGIQEFQDANNDGVGEAVDTYAAGVRIDFMDLAADQTTMFFGQEGSSIRRWDLTTDTDAGNFCTGCTVNAFSMRILGDGGLLVADRNDVKRFNSAGVLIQSYDAAGENGWFALNLDPDGTSFWSGNFGTDNIYRFDIATGAQLGSFNAAAGGNLFGLAVFGEITQGIGAGPGSGPGTAPEPASLLLLGLGAAGVAIRRRFVRG